eukprot:TRINITY_DN567_c0_g2_i2.p3 TRINITY_DN567_c0_g2~~TRINITY_DN567_c0_g2_i2.p3  ORF type:complete len:119 (+),score=23.34 TRINITY_DN567_c0_g2_i2:875-1231(+)
MPPPETPAACASAPGRTQSRVGTMCESLFSFQAGAKTTAAVVPPTAAPAVEALGTAAAAAVPPAAAAPAAVAVDPAASAAGIATAATTPTPTTAPAMSIFVLRPIVRSATTRVRLRET